MNDHKFDAERKELSDEIDATIRKLGCDFYASELLHKQNADLKEQVKKLLEDQQNTYVELERKNKQIVAFVETIESVNQKFRNDGQDTKEKFSFQANIVGMQYEIEILHSKIKSLERELIIQRNENERLRRASQHHMKGTK